MLDNDKDKIVLLQYLFYEFLKTAIFRPGLEVIRSFSFHLSMRIAIAINCWHFKIYYQDK